MIELKRSNLATIGKGIPLSYKEIYMSKYKICKKCGVSYVKYADYRGGDDYCGLCAFMANNPREAKKYSKHGQHDLGNTASKTSSAKKAGFFS
jgi:hypothetical protein